MPSLPLVLVLALLAAPVAWAEGATFRVLLGGRELGTLSHEGSPDGTGTLATALGNTPLGAFDGTWQGTTGPAPAEAGEDAHRFVGASDLTEGGRVVTVDHADGRALATSIDPPSEATEMSSPSRVPVGVLDPVEAFARLYGAGGCPAPFRIYDGRRVVEVSPAGSEPGSGLPTYHADYRVTMGPGHLSPFRFNGFNLNLFYDEASGAFLGADVSTGPFAESLRR